MTATPTPDHAEWRFPNEATRLGSPAYYAIRFSPEPHRDLLAMLLAWFGQVQSIARSPSDPGVARLKLDWWRTEIDQTLNEHKPRHPLSTALCGAGLNQQAAEPMRAILDANEQRIRQPELADIAAFTASCDQTGGNLFVLACQPADGSAYNLDRCRALGSYWIGLEQLRRFPADPATVPIDVREKLVNTVDSDTRQAAFDQLARYPGSAKALRAEPVPDVARRLVAASQAFHHRVMKDGYQISPRNVQRAPIANLWTAWRCRPSL